MKFAVLNVIVATAFRTSLVFECSKIKSIELGIKDSKSRFSFYKDGFLVAGLSPKAIIFFGTIFSSFIDFSISYIGQFIILMSTYVILDFITFLL